MQLKEKKIVIFVWIVNAVTRKIRVGKVEVAVEIEGWTKPPASSCNFGASRTTHIYRDRTKFTAPGWDAQEISGDIVVRGQRFETQKFYQFVKNVKRKKKTSN